MTHIQRHKLELQAEYNVKVREFRKKMRSEFDQEIEHWLAMFGLKTVGIAGAIFCLGYFVGKI